MSTSGPENWRALSPYLDRALEMTGEERVAWLASLRESDPDLAGELQSLLEQHRELSDERFLEGRATALPGEPAAAGQAVGAYTLVAPIGYGGMGTVWLARRSDGRFERRAAVKFLNIALLGRGEARFRREGRILGRLTHPHIAQLLDAGVTGDGQAYLVLEHVDGEPIDRYCVSQALGVDARIRLMLDVLAAVAHAHANLVVHRDIKPSNVLVAADGQVKLLDFGIARLLENDALAAAPTMLTRDGAGPFTPECAAPEQLTGDPVTTATDVYALGVLLYVLLTGQHPAGASLGSPAALVRAITDLDPPRPSDVVEGNLRRALRGDLDTIVSKTLKKRPEERYASVTALADDLRRYLARQPVGARPDTLAYRARTFVRRNRPVVALATLALVAIVAGTAGILVQETTVRAQRDFALHQLSRAEAINGLNSFILSDAAPSGKPFTVNELLARAERIVERQRGDPASRADLLTSIGHQYLSQDQDDNGRRVLAEAYAASRGLQDPSVQARASCALAASLAAGGQIPRADALVREGLAELPSQPQYVIDRIFCLISGSQVSLEAGRSQEGVDRVRSAQALITQSPLRSDILRLNVLMSLAECYRTNGQLREADAAFAQASALLTSLGRDDTQTAGTVFNNWALTLYFLGRPREAEHLFRRGIAISSAGDAEQGVSPMLLVNEARALRDLGRLAEARDYAERGYAKARQAGDDVVINQSLMLQASVYRMEGDPDRASRALAEVEPRLRRALPPGHYALAALMREQAFLAQARGDPERALATADRAIGLAEASVTAGRQGRELLPPLLLLRSDVERELGRAPEATTDATRAVGLLHADVGSDAPSNLLGLAYLALGRALRAEDRVTDASAAFRAAFHHLESTLGSDHPDTRAARRLMEATVAPQ